MGRDCHEQLAPERVHGLVFLVDDIEFGVLESQVANVSFALSFVHDPAYRRPSRLALR